MAEEVSFPRRLWRLIKRVVRRVRVRVRNRIPYESGNYPYLTARVKAKRSKLYPPDVYPRLLQMEVAQIARFLGEGTYKEEILALGARLRGVDLIERATANKLADMLTELIDLSEGRLREMIALYLDRWDVSNIKTILRGKLYGAPAAELEDDLIAAGSLDAEFLRSLVEADSVAAVFDALEGTIYDEARQQMGEEFDAARDLARYEDALAHVYYRRLLAAIQPRTDPSRFFLQFVRREIDILNLKTLLRLWKAKSKVSRDMFLEGGLELSEADLQVMVGLDENALLARLSGTHLYAEAGAAIRAIKEEGVAAVERVLERAHLKEASRYSHLHPLSVLPVLDFVARKTVEVENLRILVRGKERGIPQEKIQELLVI